MQKIVQFTSLNKIKFEPEKSIQKSELVCKTTFEIVIDPAESAVHLPKMVTFGV